MMLMVSLKLQYNVRKEVLVKNIHINKIVKCVHCWITGPTCTIFPILHGKLPSGR
jgi:hypothetical protein